MNIKMNIKLLFGDIWNSFIGLNKYVAQEFKFIYFTIAVVHFILTFYTDSLIFEYQDVNIFSIIRIKTIFFIILILIWQLIGYVVKNYPTSAAIKAFIKFSGIYFLIIMIFQLSLWPFIVGNQMYYGYFNDTIHLTNTAVFQGIFIKYFRIYSLMLIPNISGISIVQIIIISLIIGHIMQKIKVYFNLNKSIYFFYIPFLSPLIIQYNLHMEKDVIYGYCLLFLISVLLFVKLNKSPDRLNKNLFLIAFLSAVVASIRPGGIFFFVATPFMLYFLNYKFMSFRKILLFIVFNLIMSLIFIPNIISTVVFNKYGDSYKNIYILNNTFKVLLQEAVENDNEYVLDEFDSGTSLKSEKLLSKNMVLGDGFFTELPERDQDKFEIISQKLMEEYFYEYIEYKFKRIPKKLRIIDLNPNPHDTSAYDEYSSQSYHSIKDKIVQISPSVYAKTINFFKTYNNYLVFPYYGLIMLFISMYTVAVFVSIIFNIKKALTISCFLIGYIIFQILIVPYAGFRFFFPGYLIGYLLIFYLIFYFIGNKKNNTN